MEPAPTALQPPTPWLRRTSRGRIGGALGFVLLPAWVIYAHFGALNTREWVGGVIAKGGQEAQGGWVVPQNLALPKPQKHPKKPRRKWPGCFCRYHNASAFHWWATGPRGVVVLAACGRPPGGHADCSILAEQQCAKLCKACRYRVRFAPLRVHSCAHLLATTAQRLCVIVRRYRQCVIMQSNAALRRLIVCVCIQCGPFIETETSVTQFKVASTVAFRALMRIPRGRGCVR